MVEDQYYYTRMRTVVFVGRGITFRCRHGLAMKLSFPSKIIISSCSTGFKLFFLIKLYSLKVRHVVEGDSL